MKFLYYLAAIGYPNLDIKIEILKHNLSKIYNSINQNFDIIINCYDINTNFYDIIQKFNFTFIDNIFIHNKTGILSELWLTNSYNNEIMNYEYILFILDDIKLENINIHKLISIKNKYDIEFLSPKILKATWPYMKHPKYKNLVITNRIEIYCILMNKHDFNKFLLINDINNPNIWGVDYIMSHFNIKTAIYHNNVANHILESKSDHTQAIKQMTQFLKKYGYNSNNEIINKFNNEIIEIINDI